MLSLRKMRKMKKKKANSLFISAVRLFYDSNRLVMISACHLAVEWFETTIG
jgi:hypothetical protein